MKSLIDKLQEKELQIEALRAQIAKLEKDIETLQSAARILSDDEDSNPLADLVAPELKGVGRRRRHGQKPSNGFDPQATRKRRGHRSQLREYQDSELQASRRVSIETHVHHLCVKAQVCVAQNKRPPREAFGLRLSGMLVAHGAVATAGVDPIALDEVLVPPNLTLYLEPLLAVDSVPKVQAHLSAFSSPRESYQALRSGSVVASSSSWATMEAMPSAPALPLGLVVWAAQEERQRAGVADEGVLDVGSADGTAGVPSAVLGAEAGGLVDVVRRQHEVDAHWCLSAPRRWESRCIRRSERRRRLTICPGNSCRRCFRRR